MGATSRLTNFVCSIIVGIACDGYCGEIMDLTPSITEKRLEVSSKKLLALCKELPEYEELKSEDEIIFAIYVRNDCYNSAERLNAISSLIHMFNLVTEERKLKFANELLDIEKKAFNKKLEIVGDGLEKNKNRAKNTKLKYSIEAIQSHLVRTLKEIQ